MTILFIVITAIRFILCCILQKIDCIPFNNSLVKAFGWFQAKSVANLIRLDKKIYLFSVNFPFPKIAFKSPTQGNVIILQLYIMVLLVVGMPIKLKPATLKIAQVLINLKKLYIFMNLFIKMVIFKIEEGLSSFSDFAFYSPLPIIAILSPFLIQLCQRMFFPEA